MEGQASRVILAAPLARPGMSVWLTLVVILPLLAPMGAAQSQFKADDFGVVEELHTILHERDVLLDSELVALEANQALDPVRNGVRDVDEDDPISHLDTALDGLAIHNTTPPTFVHPAPFALLSGAEEFPPDHADTLWGTLVNLADYVVWVNYTNLDGTQTHDAFEPVALSSTLFSLFSSDPLLHDVDVDGDDDDDIRVGIRISWDTNDGWGLAGVPPTQLWVEPTIEYTIETLDPNDSLWNDLGSLRVSLFKSFSYSLNPFEPGESYIWVIDSEFTMQPRDWSLEVGFERFWFDLGASASSFVTSLIGGIIGGGVPDETDITISAIAAPYTLRIENTGQTTCPADYDPASDHLVESREHRCKVLTGFGYAHFSPPDGDEREAWELAYVEAALHPIENSSQLPSEVALTVRKDSVVPTDLTVAGEDGLTTIEYFANAPTDLWVHFHEDRSDLTPSAGEAYGNLTNSEGWFRQMPYGSLSDHEIERVFRMLGSESEPALPGQMPERLSLIIGIKNFSRDSTPNADDPTLPVNPASPPNTLVLLRSTGPVAEIDYVSHFLREGMESDHRNMRLHVTDTPDAMVLYGDFWLGGTETVDTSVDNSDLDMLSRMLDFTILALVNIFLDVGDIINSIPGALVDLIGGSASESQGMALHLELYTSFESDRAVAELGSATITMGSSSHPVGVGNHLLLAEDRALEHVDGRRGQQTPLVPIAFSLHHEGLSAVHIVDDQLNEEQEISMAGAGGEPMRILFMEMDETDIESADFQYILLAEQPGLLNLSVEPGSLLFAADTGISEVVYAGRAGAQRQSVVLDQVPGNFSMVMTDDTTWTSTVPLGEVSLMITNSSAPQTMDGDHMLFTRDDGSATLSARVHGITELGLLAAPLPGVPGPDGRATAYMTGPGDDPFHVAVLDTRSHISPGDGLNGHLLIDPLPATVAVEIPSGDGESELELPEFTTEEGLAGIAGFFAGFTGFGESLNDMLSGMVTSLTGVEGEAREDVSLGLELAADQSFDLAIDMRQGVMPLPEPDWLHGLSIEAADAGMGTKALHMRAWLPQMPPNIDISLGYQNISELDRWDVSVQLDDWVPAHPEFMLQVNGYDGLDLRLTMLGFDTSTPTSVAIETQLDADMLPVVPELGVTTHFEMSQRLGAIHTTLLDRDAGARYELLVQDVPQRIDLAASLGTDINIGMSVPVEYRRGGRAVESMMVQTTRWADGAWWPATIFLHDIPGEMNLTTTTSTVFDITQPIGFQGSQELHLSSSGAGMDMFISAKGRAINARGDMLLMAENVASHMDIEPTADFGLRIRSSGDGIGRLYLRSADVPAQPGVHLVQLEAAGEDLKSATVHQTAVADIVPIITLSDIQGGRIIATARADITVNGWTFDGRGVLIDAQSTNGIPTGSTIGVNGLAADLSLLNLMGFEGTSTHYLVPEPISSGVVTLVATLLR